MIIILRPSLNLSHPYHFTYAWVEFHQPYIRPTLECIQYLLTWCILPHFSLLSRLLHHLQTYSCRNPYLEASYVPRSRRVMVDGGPKTVPCSTWLVISTFLEKASLIWPLFPFTEVIVWSLKFSPYSHLMVQLLNKRHAERYQMPFGHPNTNHAVAHLGNFFSVESHPLAFSQYLTDHTSQWD